MGIIRLRRCSRVCQSSRLGAPRKLWLIVGDVVLGPAYLAYLFPVSSNGTVEVIDSLNLRFRMLEVDA
jgi:hypothetical protein